MNDQQDDIDRYLNGAMDEQEKRSFLLLLDQDPALRQEFAKQEKLAELIGLAAMQEELQSIHTEMEAGSHGVTVHSPVKRIPGRWWLAAAAILLVVLGSDLLTKMSNPPGKKLFTAWYEPEPGLPTLMGAGQNDQGLMEAMVDYKTKDYPSAILRFRALLPYPRSQSPGLSHTDTVAFFYLASSYLADGRYDSSYRMFGKLAGPEDPGPEDHYSRLAQWYEALNCLRLGRKKEADSLLLKISSDPIHPFREKAIKLAKELGSLPVNATTKTFAHAWWLDEHNRDPEAAALIKDLLDRLPKHARKDSLLRYLSLYLFTLPEKAADSAEREAETMLDHHSPSYTNDLLQCLNGKTRWLLTNHRIGVGRQALDSCDKLIRNTPAAGIDSLSLVSFWENQASLELLVSGLDSAKGLTEKCLRYHYRQGRPYPDKLMTNYTRLGVINKLLLQVKGSLRDFDSADLYLQRLGRDGGVSEGILYMNKGNLWLNIGEFDKAVENYKQAGTIFGALKDTLELGLLNHNTGLLYFDQYDYEKAMKYAKLAEKYLLQVLPPGHSRLLLAEQQLAIVSDELGDTLDAGRYLTQMMTITRANFRPAEVNYLTSESKIAAHYARTGKIDTGIAIYRSILRKMKSAEPVAGQFTDDICYDLATTCYENDRYAEAYTYYSQCAGQEARIYGPLNIFTLYTINMAATCLMEQRLFRRAAMLLYPVKSSLDYLQIRGMLGTHANNFYKWQIPFCLLTCRYKLCPDNKDSLDNLLRELVGIEPFANAYLKQLTGSMDKGAQRYYEEYYSLGITICQALYRKTHDRHYIEMAFGFSEKKKEIPLRLALKKQIAMHFAGVPDSLVKKEQDLSAKLAYTEKNYAAAMGDHDSLGTAFYDEVLSGANMELDKLILELETKYKNYYSLKYDLGVAGTRECRDYIRASGGAWLQYTIADDSLYAIVITEKNMGLFKLAGTRTADSLTEAFKTALRNNDPADFRHSSFALYKLLFAPLRGLLPGKKQLVIATEGKLQGIPWEALISSGEARPYEQLPYLLKDYLICYSSGITGQKDQETIHGFDRGEATGQFFSFAPGFTDDVKQQTFNNTHDSSYMRLIRQPWALETASSSAELFHGISYTGMEATSDAYFRQTLHAGILHFGTHALWNDRNPMLSRLYLVPGSKDPGGGLYTYDIFAHQTQARLAVLAACQTGVSGEDPGLGRISLAKAFSFAGCPNQVMTLWDVDDEATAALIKDFYKLVKTGRPAAEALQEAKKRLLETNPGQGWPNPYYWSGIVYFGNDEPISPASAPSAAGWQHPAPTVWLIILALALCLLAYFTGIFPPIASLQKK
jgi:CHAT domain-containing protein